MLQLKLYDEQKGFSTEDLRFWLKFEVLVIGKAVLTGFLHIC